MNSNLHANFSLRNATEEDARFLVSLISESSGGVWPALWEAQADEGESVEKFGVRYLTNRKNNLSITNAIVAVGDNTPKGAMVCYQEGVIGTDQTNERPAKPLPPELIKALRPYSELSDPESLFIAEIGCLPSTRGQGLGTRLINHAKALAKEQEYPRLSLRVFSENEAAVRLYKRLGFQVAGELKVVEYPKFSFAGNILLMTCSM